MDMQTKYKGGKWTDENEKSFNKLKKYLLDYYALLSKENNKLLDVAYTNGPNKINGSERIINSIIRPVDVDVDSICKLNKELNDFIMEYCRVNKLV